MKRNILLILMFIMATVSIHSQGTVFVKCGLCSASYWGENSIGTSSKDGYMLGIGMDSQIGTSNFTVAPAVELISKGGNVEVDEERHTTIEAVYIEVPLDFIYHYKIVKESFLNFSAGPYIAYGIGGETSGVKTFDDQTGLERMDVGVNFGLGYEYKMLLLNASCDLGLKNVASNSPKNFAFILSLGIKL